MASGDLSHDLKASLGGKGFHLFVFIFHVPVVQNDAEDLGIGPVLKVLYGGINVAGGIKGHLFPGGDDQDLFRISS